MGLLSERKHQELNVALFSFVWFIRREVDPALLPFSGTVPLRTSSKVDCKRRLKNVSVREDLRSSEGSAKKSFMKNLLEPVQVEIKEMLLAT